MKHLSILHTFALGVALVPCLSSCISDDSQEGNKPLSLISAAQTVEDALQLPPSRKNTPLSPCLISGK